MIVNGALGMALGAILAGGLISLGTLSRVASFAFGAAAAAAMRAGQDEEDEPRGGLRAPRSTMRRRRAAPAEP